MSAKSFDIVAYQKQDHEAVCSLLVESFKAKFQENEDVVGVLSLKWKWKAPSSSLPETNPISLAPLLKQFGCFNVFKFLTGMHALEYTPAANECYIDHLAIRSSHRNQGIGRRLLAFAQQFTVESGFHALTLHVAYKNQGAIRLYHKLAFEVEQSKYNGLRHFWFKEPVWHLMSWKENLHSRREHR
ncbi:N-acetyltransferase [Paenibacillus sp. F4]|uniref:GNAT family N-acetyltransferase n=1 Tax=Paenibacillus sp. F4 TaxID=357385 RepID=UPI000C9EDE5A|nr:GNAT family N-acetyltransferase [Paenibacillus sp. F4]PNQ81547.1 N-acetyltransferase [Paenibacillus sp. F4]